MSQATPEKDRTESWIETLASAASHLGAGEALAELGTQARELLSEVRRAAADAAADATVIDDDQPANQRSASEHRPDPIDTSGLAGKLDGLSSSLEELADLLDAGLERLETVEMQLGDPDESVDARLRAGIESCERRLGGLEHGLQELTRAVSGKQAAAAKTLVLVLDGDCRRRCDLCVGLEHQGLHTLAAPDIATALRMLRENGPDAVLARCDADADDVEAIVEALADLDRCRGLVLVPGRIGRDVAATLHRNFDGWHRACDEDGYPALAEQIALRRSLDIPTPTSLTPMEQEETKADAT